MNLFGFAQARNSGVTAAAFLAIIAIPLAIALEQENPKIWNDRISIPSFSALTNLHTPREYTGLFLPPTISTSQTITLEDSPVIITGTTTILPNTTLTLEPGTEIFMHEYASLVVEGTLVVNGTFQQGVTFTTNEEHPSNQSWAGIVFASTGRGTITNAHLKFGSPGITCNPDSAAVIQHTTIELGNLGMYTASPNCSISKSVIKNVDTGIISLQKSNFLRDTIISARDVAVKTIESTRIPTTNRPSL